MTTPPPIIRVCPEHLVKLWTESRILERIGPEFLSREEPKRKERPFTDHLNNTCWWTILLFVVDPRYPVGDYRHSVAEQVNRHRENKDSGIFCGSGKWDPGKSRLQIDGNLYGRFKTKGGKEPHCELCENGDMIQQRFYDSVYGKTGSHEPNA